MESCVSWLRKRGRREIEGGFLGCLAFGDEGGVDLMVLGV
jgi:hypothetical protein